MKLFTAPSFWLKAVPSLALATLLGCASKVPLYDANAAPIVPNSSSNSNATTSAVGAGGVVSGGVISSSALGSVGADPRSIATVRVEDVRNAGAGPAASLTRVVFFDFDSYALRPESRPTLEAHANFLLRNRGSSVKLQGHTDELGGREYNLALGQKRALAVQDALRLLGVPAAQLEATSFGKEKPAAEGGSEAAMAQNRRVELVY